MTLTVHDNVEQGSDDWIALRRGIVTASTVGQLITPRTIKPASNDTSRALTMLLVAERITGYTDPTYTSDDMMRGHMDEPIARGLYSEHVARVREVGFMTLEEPGFKLGYSPDGVVGDAGLIEVKSRRSKKQLATILSGQVPLENMAQVQSGLLVSGREWLDYVSFSGGMPMWVERVYPDERWFAAIREAVKTFEATAAEMVAKYERAVEGLVPTERLGDLEMRF